MRAGDYTGIAVSDALNKVAQDGFIGTVAGSGNTVVAQIPQVSSKMAQGGTIVLYTDQESLQTAEKVTVPNFVGYTAMEVNGVAAEYGLNVSFTGAVSAGGIAAAQSVPEGTQVAPGTVVSVTFAANTEGGSSD